MLNTKWQRRLCEFPPCTKQYDTLVVVCDHIVDEGEILCCEEHADFISEAVDQINLLVEFGPA